MSDNHNHHIVPLKYLIRTFLTLLVLTVLTVAFAMVNFSDFNHYLPRQMDLGPLNIIFAVGIATIKVCLVLAIFMAIIYDKQLNKAIVLMNFFFVSIFFIFVVTDTLFRSVADPMEGLKLPFESPVIKANENPVHHGEVPGSPNAPKAHEKAAAADEFVEDKSAVVVEVDTAKHLATDSAVPAH